MPNVFSVATEGKELRYGSIGLPVELWGPWRVEADTTTAGPAADRDGDRVDAAPARGARLAANFTAVRHRQRKRRIKIIARYQQYEGANKIVERVVAGQPEEGPDLALPGLGQVAADGLRRPEAPPAPGAEEPDGADRGRPHRPRHPDHRHLLRRRHAQPGQGRHPRGAAASCSAQDVRKIIITTIHKFGEADGVLNDRGNIIAWSTRPTAPRRATSAARCARRCRTRSCSA